MNPSYKLAVSLCFIALLTVTAAQFNFRDHQDYSTLRKIGRRRCIPVGRPCSRFRRRCCKRSTCRRIVFGKGRRRRVRRLCVSPNLPPSVTPSPTASPSVSPVESSTPTASPSPSPALDPCVALWFESSIMPATFAELSQLTDECPTGPASTNTFNFLRVPAPLCTGSCGTIVFTTLFAQGFSSTGTVDCLASVLKLGYPYSSVAEIPPCSTIGSPTNIDLVEFLDLAIPQEFVDGAASCTNSAQLTFFGFEFPLGENAQTLEAGVCGT